MMTNFTSQMKKYLIRATLLFLSVVAFLCPLDYAYAYELDDYLTSFSITSISSGGGSWTAISPSTRTSWFSGDCTVGGRECYRPDFGFNPLPFQKGNYVVFTVNILTKANSLPDSCLSSNSTWSVLECNTDFEVIDYNNTQSLLPFQTTTNGTNGWAIPINNTGSTITITQEDQYIIGSYRYLVRYEGSDTNLTYMRLNGILATAESNGLVMVNVSHFSLFKSGTTLKDILQYMQDHPDDAGQQMEQNKQETEQAQSDAQSAGNTAQSDASTAGQTLLGALTSFIGAITNASPGNCSLTLNTGYGFNLGEVNLCSISPPASFQVISSLVVIGFAVPLSISASKKMIELFRGFTG